MNASFDLDARLRTYGEAYVAATSLPPGFHERLMDRLTPPRQMGFLVPRAVAFAVPAVMAFLLGITVATQLANRSRTTPSQNPPINIFIGATPTAPVSPSPGFRVGPEPSATPAAGAPSSPASGQVVPQGSRPPNRTPGPQGSATANGSPPACQAADLSDTTTTDASSYSAGQQVTISVTARNVSNHVCYLPADSHLNFKVADSSGTVVWTYTYGSTAGGPTYSPTDMSPGQSITRYAFWDQSVNYPAATGQRAATGNYTATAGWDSFTAQSAPFKLQ